MIAALPAIISASRLDDVIVSGVALAKSRSRFSSNGKLAGRAVRVGIRSAMVMKSTASPSRMNSKSSPFV
ncbi:hypothetical protein [Novosphingobium cyanobacteriorum]|uniref:Uncharacterized protein n=1 Tax=Novosphingobium cyanobacteriorum TaxID=3024215 RepID=A0ABT6CDL4_9SPHN|nr:hypothetical protein [Novosphingobium cyanobacteriorum]MDF8332017.1 hypothetical protein [Novosphingobium cyanobacteriorum]